MGHHWWPVLVARALMNCLLTTGSCLTNSSLCWETGRCFRTTRRQLEGKQQHLFPGKLTSMRLLPPRAANSACVLLGGCHYACACSDAITKSLHCCKSLKIIFLG